MTDLIAQWLSDSVPGIDPVDLKRRGVTFRAAQKVGGVRAGKGGWWVLPVYVDPPSIWRIVEEPVLLDFVKFDPDHPERWQSVYMRGVMLGEAAFQEARLDKLPLPVFKNPLHWLQAGGAGVFPLDAEAFAREVTLYPPITLHPEDLDHGRDLRDLMERAFRLQMPEIMVPA